MTFHEQPVSPTQMLIDPKKKSFMQWGMKNVNRLFTYSVGKDALIDKMYVFAKRLHGISHKDFLMMDEDDRDVLYEWEKQLIEAENKNGSRDLENMNQ